MFIYSGKTYILHRTKKKKTFKGLLGDGAKDDAGDKYFSFFKGEL